MILRTKLLKKLSVSFEQEMIKSFHVFPLNVNFKSTFIENEYSSGFITFNKNDSRRINFRFFIDNDNVSILRIKFNGGLNKFDEYKFEVFKRAIDLITNTSNISDIKVFDEFYDHYEELVWKKENLLDFNFINSLKKDECSCSDEKGVGVDLENHIKNESLPIKITKNGNHILKIHDDSLLTLCPLCGGKLFNDDSVNLFYKPSYEDYNTIRKNILYMINSIDDLINILGKPDYCFGEVDAFRFDYFSGEELSNILCYSYNEKYVVLFKFYECGLITFNLAGKILA